MPRARRRALGTPALISGVALGYLSVIVLVPLAALVAKGSQGGWHHFWQVAWNPESRAALEADARARGGGRRASTRSRAPRSRGRSCATSFRGKRLVNALIDLPFALPTIVAGLTLLALYGPNSAVQSTPRSRAGAS